MKKSLLCLGIILGLLSCDKEQVVTEQQDLDIGQQVPNTLIIGGQPIYAGYGYSPILDRPYRPAIDSYDIFESTDVPSTEIDFVATDEVEELVEFFQKGSCFGFGFNIEGDFSCTNIPTGRTSSTLTNRSDSSGGGGLKFGIGFRRWNVYSDSVAFKSRTVSVVARVKLPKYRHLVDGDPFLDFRAQDLIDNGQLDRFIRKYGPSYVDDRITGGELFYVFNYDFSELTEIERRNSGTNAEIQIGGLFGFSYSKTLTSHEISILRRSLTSHYVTCSVPGFTPQLLSNWENENTARNELQANIDRLSTYLDNNKTKAATISMSLRSYADIYDIQPLRAEFDEQMTCYMHWEEWVALRARIAFVHQNTTSGSMRSQAQSALNQIDQNITRSRDCNNSVAPSPNAYANIKL